MLFDDPATRAKRKKRERAKRERELAKKIKALPEQGSA